ncbi:MAG: mucoidy inhibitor MuiA family protein [Planctomycetota bacterium]|jgi:uncharacterized protein (TIGR02231 family)
MSFSRPSRFLIGTLMLTGSLALTLLLLTPPAVHPQSADLPPLAPGASRTVRVVVYPEHAEITREIPVEAVEGENSVRFSNLIPLLNPHTLRASVSDGARIIGTELTTVHLEESISEEIKDLERRIVELTDLVAAKEGLRARLGEQAAFYAAVKSRLAGDMSRELTEARLSVADWQQVLQFVTDGLQQSDERSRAVELEVRELTKELELRRNERKEYAGRQPKQMKEIVVTFHSEREGRREVQIHYVVDSCIWRPSYDVHLDRSEQEIHITGYGQVAQWTGEEWTDVALSLAMTRPDLELSLPELTPMVASLDSEQMAQLAKEVSFLNTLTQVNLEKWSTERFKRRQDRETFRRNVEQLARRSSKDLAQYGLSAEMLQGAMRRLVNRFASVQYDVAQRETISFNSSPQKVVTFSAKIPAKLKYVATPALGDSVLLQGEIVNTTGHPILEGSVALFIDDSYIGASTMASAAQNEGLSFGFGPYDALVVERRLLSRTVEGPKAFRQSQVITYQYEITVENFDDREVEIEVMDQVPISKTADIQVIFLESNRQRTLDTQTGILRWALEVDEGDRESIVYSFSVECPVGKDVHWQ